MIIEDIRKLLENIAFFEYAYINTHASNEKRINEKMKIKLILRFGLVFI